MAKYLNGEGLSTVWDTIKETFAPLSDIPTALSQLTNDVGYVDATEAAAVAPVQSVNSQTGDVVLTIPTKTSELENNSNFVSDANYVHTDNNFTNADSTKLSGIESGAEVNILETVKVNGSALTPQDKAVDITIPSPPTKTSDLENDSDFVSDANYVHTDNNFTNADVTKLSGIASGAEVNVVETVKVNGTALTPTDKSVDITIPSSPSSETWTFTLSDGTTVTKDVAVWL
jgi:Cu/Ag efflux protein CusF